MFFFLKDYLQKKKPSEIYAICATYHISYNYEFDDLGDCYSLKADCDICFLHIPQDHWFPEGTDRFIDSFIESFAHAWAMFDSSSDVWSDMFGGHSLENMDACPLFRGAKHGLLKGYTPEN